MNEPNSNFDDLILDGIRFLESLTRYYGADRGIEMWNQFGHVMGDEVRNQIFVNMLTGKTSNRLHLRRGTCAEAVEAIRAIRMHTGLSLKEAKDMYDLSYHRDAVVECTGRNEKHDLTKELRRLGMYVE